MLVCKFKHNSNTNLTTQNNALPHPTPKLNTAKKNPKSKPDTNPKYNTNVNTKLTLNQTSL